MANRPGKLIADFQFRPIVDKDGQVVLHDIYVSYGRGPLKWIGSRRTIEQCREEVNAHLRQIELSAEGPAPA
jgi:hypothetical protein